MANQSDSVVWVVVRLDLYSSTELTASSLKQAITLRGAMPSMEEVDREAQRLNDLNGGKASVY